MVVLNERVSFRKQKLSYSILFFWLPLPPAPQGEAVRVNEITATTTYHHLSDTLDSNFDASQPDQLILRFYKV